MPVKQAIDERPTSPPKVVVIGGPNGAGKSTTARRILQGALAVDEFVNADVIASGLSGFAPESAALEAGRIMLTHLQLLAARSVNFSFETTVASRSFAPWIRGLIQDGYEFHLVFIWLPNPDACIERVRDRVRRGGHSVPDSTIRRRHGAGIANFFELYMPLTTSWQVLYNGIGGPNIVAEGVGQTTTAIPSENHWRLFEAAGKR